MSRTVWKFGSRWSDWGDPDAGIADSVFYKYNIAFANTHSVLDARAGHLIALANGYTIVAIGEILSAPKQIEELGIVFSQEDRKRFFNNQSYPYEANDNDSNVCGCIIRYYWLNENTSVKPFQYKKAGRFFHASDIEQKVNDLWNILDTKK